MIVSESQINKEELYEFLKVNGEDEVDFLQSARLTFTSVAMNQEEIVAALIAWTSTVHPACTYFSIIVHPLYAHIQAENLLLSTARKQGLLTLPLQTIIIESSKQLNRFYMVSGFVKIKKTYMPLLQLSSKDVEIVRSTRYKIETVDTYIKNEKQLNQLTKMVKKHYEETHRYNPVADLPILEWRKLMLADDVMMDTSFVYVDEKSEQIIAYSFLHTSERSNVVELGWVGSKSNQHIPLISQLVSRQVKIASEQGYEYMEGEFDTTNPYAMHVYKELEFPSCTGYVTYQLRR